MSKQKNPYVKPKITIIPQGSPRYNEIMALLITEDAKIKGAKKVPPPDKST